MYSISTRLRVNNHRSLFFYLNIFVISKYDVIGKTRGYLANTASKPCFSLYIIHLVVRGLFSMFLVLMYSAE